VIYEQARGIHGATAYGTELEFNEVGYERVRHSPAPHEAAAEQPRVLRWYLAQDPPWADGSECA